MKWSKKKKLNFVLDTPMIPCVYWFWGINLIDLRDIKELHAYQKNGSWCVSFIFVHCGILEMILTLSACIYQYILIGKRNSFNWCYLNSHKNHHVIKKFTFLIKIKIKIKNSKRKFSVSFMKFKRFVICVCVFVCICFEAWCIFLYISCKVLI